MPPLQMAPPLSPTSSSLECAYMAANLPAAYTPLSDPLTKVLNWAPVLSLCPPSASLSLLNSPTQARPCNGVHFPTDSGSPLSKSG